MMIRYSPPPPEAKRLEPWFEDEEEEGGPETNHSYLRRAHRRAAWRSSIVSVDRAALEGPGFHSPDRADLQDLPRR